MLMKSILTTLALSVAPLWMAGVFPGAGERSATAHCCKRPACCKTVAVTPGKCCKTVSAIAATPQTAVVLSADDLTIDRDAPQAFVAYTGTPGNVSAIPTSATDYVLVAGNHAQNGAWLGVQIGEVPEALSAQFDLDGRGILITNVVEDSPAEEAGLSPNDVVVSLDGQTVDGDAAEFGQMVGKHDPDDEITLSVLRNGTPRSLDVTLGSRPTQYVWQIRDDGDNDLIEEDTFSSTGRIILQGPGGKWVVKDLRDLGELDELGDDIKALIPEVGTMSKFVHKGDGGHSFQIHLNRNGQNINVSREGNGDITVTRKDEDGEETTTVYQNEDALRDGDEEAFDVYNQSHGTFAFSFDTDDFGNLKGLAELNVKLEGMKVDTDTLHEQLQGILTDAEDSVHGAIAGLHKMDLDIDGADFDWQEMLKNHGEWRKHFDAGQNAFAFQFGKPRHTFEINDDGSIEVRIRKGDSELLRKFESADDLADRNPRLFKKYEALIEADQDE